MHLECIGNFFEQFDCLLANIPSLFCNNLGKELLNIISGNVFFLTTVSVLESEDQKISIF